MDKQKIKAELEKELEALVQAFGQGRELTVRYEPRNRIADFYDEERHVGGEYREDTKELIVHRTTLDGAIETLTHEFFEYLLEPLYGDHVDAFNIIVPDILKAYGKAFSKMQYKKKETVIALLTKVWLKKRSST